MLEFADVREARVARRRVGARGILGACMVERLGLSIAELADPLLGLEMRLLGDFAGRGRFGCIGAPLILGFRSPYVSANPSLTRP